MRTGGAIRIPDSRGDGPMVCSDATVFAMARGDTHARFSR